MPRLGPDDLEDVLLTIVGTVKTPRDKLASQAFGFIVAPDGLEYFFHRSAALDFEQLDQGVGVRFMPTSGPKGLRAEAVELNRPPVF